VARLISVNVGLPAIIGESRGRKLTSAIVKKSVSGPVFVTKLNLEGDKQADLKVHGGVDKAAYGYPSEHYDYWEKKFPDVDLPWGSFGENLTTLGLHENRLHVGDSLEIGSAVFEVTQPRFPCNRLAMRFGTQKMIKSFLDSERSGFYLKVLKEGSIMAGDAIRHRVVDPHSKTIISIVQDVKKSGN
jgi:MOSC domain-containing protein YiiM